MDRIAFIIGETFIYWSSIVLTLSALTAICLFLAFYLNRQGNALAAAAVIPLSLVLSLIFARFMHWYCRADSYISFQSAMTNYGSGGYALMGVFAGCALAAVLVRLARISDDLPAMLDSMSLAGCGAIAVGRLACFFNTQDRGQIVAYIRDLPWVYPVVNAVSGAQEFRLATFVIQAMVTGVIFVILAIFALVTRRKRPSGDLTLIFLLLYCASQVVLDSTRYDSLFFRSNGFVSIVQVLSACGLGLACILFSARLIRNNGYCHWYLGLWFSFAGFMGLGGYMEYYVQRHGDQPVFAYSWMSAALVGIITVVLVIRFLAGMDLRPMIVRSEVQRKETRAVAAQAKAQKARDKQLLLEMLEQQRELAAQEKASAADAQPEKAPDSEEQPQDRKEGGFIPLESVGLNKNFMNEE